MPHMMNHSDPASSQLSQEYDNAQRLLQSQPVIVQRFLQQQAQQIADALLQRLPQVRFSLPDRVSDPQEKSKVYSIPAGQREQLAGGLMDRLTRVDLRQAFRQRMAELEQNSNPGVALAGGLIRHATCMHMVHTLLPAGRSITYTAAEGEEIPTIPSKSDLEPESAITATTDAIAEEGGADAGRGELLVPFVPAARRFYLPQWVAFDDQNNLLVNSVNEAEAHILSMERYVEILHAAVHLSPYMVADSVYQDKRYGMLGQMINQGRALAYYETREIIATIQKRASANDLNRGLSLSLPYFDDQNLKMCTHDFEIIPAGRIMFVPAFVVRAAREEQAKVAQDTRLSASTRKHLLAELRILETSFSGGR